MKVMILAGGYGTRLYPLIQDTPKALLDVCGKTLIDHTIEKFFDVKGIDEVVVVTNAKFFDLLFAWSHKRKDFPFPVRVLNDGTRTPEERLGAIGDVLFVLEQESVLSDWTVVGSDNLFNGTLTNFFDFALRQKDRATIGCYDIRNRKDASKYGVIELDEKGRVVSLEEKPKDPRSSLISMCLYYFPRSGLSSFSKFIQETGNRDTTGGYIQWLYQKEDVYGFRFDGKWYDIGSLESYHQAQKEFLG